MLPRCSDLLASTAKASFHNLHPKQPLKRYERQRGRAAIEAVPNVAVVNQIKSFSFSGPTFRNQQAANRPFSKNPDFHKRDC